MPCGQIKIGSQRRVVASVLIQFTVVVLYKFNGGTLSCSIYLKASKYMPFS